MAIAHESEEKTVERVIRFHHGTYEPSANDLLQNGIDQQHAAAWNGSGEFWATTGHHRAEWFALSHPSSPPVACFEFDLPESVLVVLFDMNPPVVRQHGPNDYEFLPGSHALLNQYVRNKQVVPVL
jgi:hypothetical protein